jgi:hypothetical protein
VATKKDSTDLLAEMDTAPSGDVIDLLGEIDEGDDAKAWMPETGDGVQGTVVSLGTRPSDYPAADGSIIQCPVVTLETTAGEKVRITAFQSVLRGAIQEAEPRVGDLFAAKYFGKISNKKGTGSYHSYKVAVRRGLVTAGSGPAKAPF